MNKTEEINLYLEALAKWKNDAQIGMFFEEMGELIDIVAKSYWRRRGSMKQIAKEIADVEIMIGQIKEIFNIRDLCSQEKEKQLKELRTQILNCKI